MKETFEIRKKLYDVSLNAISFFFFKNSLIGNYSYYVGGQSLNIDKDLCSCSHHRLMFNMHFVISMDVKPCVLSQPPFLSDRFLIWAVFSCEGLISISKISAHPKHHFNLVFQFPVHSLHKFSSKNRDAWKLAFLDTVYFPLTFWKIP